MAVTSVACPPRASLRTQRRLRVIWTRSGLVVSASDCGVRGLTQVRVSLRAVAFIATATATCSLGQELRTYCSAWVNSALHPSGVAISRTSFSLSKGGDVTSAGWQVTLCDPIWHVSSRSGEAGLHYPCKPLYRVSLYFTFCSQNNLDTLIVTLAASIAVSVMRLLSVRLYRPFI